MNATYTCNGLSYPATIRLEEKGLFIALQQQDAMGEVLWQYRSIRPSERTNFFTYHDYPPQTLEVLDPQLAEALRQASLKPPGGGVARFGPLAKVALVVTALFAVLYLAVIPWMAGLLASRFPESYEQQLGDRIYQSMKNEFTIDRNATATANRFFQALRFPSSYPVQITVVKGDVVNAFALPGGHIVIYDKLLRGINSYEELAALMAHELVHVQERHTIRSLFRQLGSVVFLSLLIGDAGAISATVLSNANELKNLSYSRTLESEADQKGVQLLTQRGISCTGFVNLFRFLEKQTQGPQPVEWMSSHPDLKKRIRNVQSLDACETAGKNEQLHSLFLQLKTAE